MARQPIPEETQKRVLMKSRRRCCLCFWLHGTDEVQKGQIAHLDGDNENSAEENLAFLCFDHHDDYDGKTRLAKGLKENEVRQWRNELYKEMEYRFRTVKKRECALTIERLKLIDEDNFKAIFRVTNIGEEAVRTPTVAIRLPHNVKGEIPRAFEPWKAMERRLDIFEQNGRVTVHELGGMNPVLISGHAYSFEALVFNLVHHPLGSRIELEYRIDAEGMMSVRGNISTAVPKALEEF